MSFPHGLMFHHFHDGINHKAAEGSISAEQFNQMLDFYGDRVLPAEAWLEAATQGRLQPDRVCITFDDNLLCQKDVALPLLKERRLTAMWFVYSSALLGAPTNFEVFRNFRTTRFANPQAFCEAFAESSHVAFPRETAAALDGFVPTDYLKEFSFYSPPERIYRYLRDRGLGAEAHETVLFEMMKEYGYAPVDVAGKLWITQEDVRGLSSAGHIFGLHSSTHPMRMEILSRAAQEKEYSENADLLAALTGRRPKVMAHPVNSFNDDTFDILRSLGVDFGFGTTMQTSNDGPLRIPREDAANIATRLL